jgi:hypothetical protein
MKTKFAIMFNCSELPNISTFKKQLGQVKNISRIDPNMKPPTWIGIKNIQAFSDVVNYISILLKSAEGYDPEYYQLYAFSDDANPLILQLSKSNHIAYTFEADANDIEKFMENEGCFTKLINSSQSIHSLGATLFHISEKLNPEDSEKIQLEEVTASINPSAEVLYNLSRDYLKRMELLLKSNWKNGN